MVDEGDEDALSDDTDGRRLRYQRAAAIDMFEADARQTRAATGK